MSGRAEHRDKAPFVCSRASGRCLIQVCGGNRLLNELLGAYLADRSARLCGRVAEGDATPCSRGLRRRVPCLRLDIIDAAEFDLPREWPAVSRSLAKASEHVMAVFFNVPEDAPAGLEREALARGVRGVFYRSDSPATLEKGIEAIVSGDVWFRRELLYRAATGTLGRPPAPPALETGARAIVTHRERHALRCLAQGMTNQEISDELCVSVHTVKTHLYRIYRKIGVKNRHQAALWALELGATGAAAGLEPAARAVDPAKRRGPAPADA